MDIQWQEERYPLFLFFNFVNIYTIVNIFIIIEKYDELTLLLLSTKLGVFCFILSVTFIIEKMAT